MTKSQITIYTDGSCLYHGYSSNVGGWAAVIEDGEEQLIINGQEHSTTNQRMELKAVIEGIKCIENKDQLIDLYVDSAYVLNGCQEWRHIWKRLGWRKKSNKKPVENLDLWKELDALLEEYNVVLHKVKAHSGDTMNDLADSLASAASHGLLVKEYRQAGNLDFYWKDVECV